MNTQISKIDNRQNALLHSLLSSTGLTARKKELVISFTDGRAESSKELSQEEANELIQYLKRFTVETEAEKADKMRKKIISMAHQMEWKLPNGKADMSRINNWCVKYSYLHLTLNNYSYSALPKLLTQFESIYYSFLQNLHK